MNYRRALANTLHLMCMLGSICRFSVQFSGLLANFISLVMAGVPFLRSAGPIRLPPRAGDAGVWKARPSTQKIFVCERYNVAAAWINHETSREVAFRPARSGIADNLPEFPARKGSA